MIGGPGAKPILKKWNLFAIVVCVNIGVGILLWGPIEPLYHFHTPPVSLGITPETPAAATFALSTVYLHNTVLPLSFATLVGLMFAFAYYNMRQPFTLGAPLAPLMGRHSRGSAGQLIDAVCLYALVAAMAASRSAAKLTSPAEAPTGAMAAAAATSCWSATVRYATFSRWPGAVS